MTSLETDNINVGIFSPGYKEYIKQYGYDIGSTSTYNDAEQKIRADRFERIMNSDYLDRILKEEELERTNRTF